LAVSGGMDSMVMLQLFRQSGYQVSLAHCNFQLRGGDSDEDEKFIRGKCAQWNIAFYSNRFDTNYYANENGFSTQMAARELRYNWFNELLQKEGFDYLATAHHLNDSIETILLNLTKGTSIEGLMGIPAQNKKIIRPLLFATREEIENYAAQEGITWREDKSNQSNDYQRNFIRHQVMPKLKEINPSLEKTFQETIYKLQGAAKIMTSAVEEWKLKHMKTEGDKIFLDKKGVGGASTLMLWEVVKPYGFNFDQCEDIIKALDGQSGKRFLSTAHELIVDRTQLVLFAQAMALEEALIQQGQGTATLGKWSMTIKSQEKSTLLADPLVATLDESRLHFPLVWRKWKAGDYFYPLGMKGKKKVSDFLIDEKVSLAEKESVTVLESAGEIAWVTGRRIDERFKVSAGTTKAFELWLQASGHKLQAKSSEQ
jgi:tRNA(Ile)-lysidine synthase